MELVLVPLATLLLAFFLLAWHLGYSMTLRPLLDSLTSRHPSFLKTASFLYKASGLKWVLHVTHVSGAVTSHFALAHFPLATRWLRGHTARVNAQAKEFGAISNDTADALGVLRHRTMPREINRRVAPVKAQAAVAERTARRSISLGRREAKERQRSISHINRKLGPIAALLLGADLFVFGRHAQTHHRHHVKDIPRIRDRDIPRLRSGLERAEGELARTRARLKRLERALGLGVVAGIVYRILARVAPWLFCRNVKKLGSLACGLNPSTMTALEALLLGTLGIASLEELARFTVAIEDEVAKEVKSLLNA